VITKANQLYGRNTFDDAALAHRIEKLPESGCWIWMRKVNKGGYGVTSVGRKTMAAHRAVYEYRTGQSIPPGMVLMHLCDVRSCVNPDHLRVGSYQDNTNDCIRKGRDYRGTRHHRSKLSEDDVRYIRANPDKPLRELGRELGVTMQCVWAVRHHRKWAHVA
jgi:hypothetical protein